MSVATKVECTVCGRQIEKLGLTNHSGKHRREFREVAGRFPESYQEVRDAYDRDADAILPGLIGGPTRVDAPDMQTTLDEYTQGATS